MTAINRSNKQAISVYSVLSFLRGGSISFNDGCQHDAHEIYVVEMEVGDL